MCREKHINPLSDHYHTKGSCKKLASQAGQDLKHLAKAVKILARSGKLVAISLAYLEDYESCKNLAHDIHIGNANHKILVKTFNLGHELMNLP